ncbi:MAG: ParB/RepB/Spo0J family partition protein [Pseudobdellovibrionaceae bacterium]
MSNFLDDSQNKKSRLGRGLSSLLGGADLNSEPSSARPAPAQTAMVAPSAGVAQSVAPAFPAEARIWQVAVDKMTPSAFQPRSHFDKAALEELATSIRANGILQPIVARKLPSGRFEIIAGERRWRAAQLAGLHEVPVILKAFDDKATLEMAIIENVQREDLNPIEEAEAYQRLADDFDLTQNQIAEKVGKDRATVANALRILSLPQKVRDLLADGSISTGHAKVLLSLQSAEQITSLAAQAAKQQISVRKLEKLVSSTKKGSQSKDTISLDVSSKLIESLAEEVQKILSTKVSIDYAEGKGKVTVHFYTDEELNNIVDRLKNGI